MHWVIVPAIGAWLERGLLQDINLLLRQRARAKLFLSVLEGRSGESPRCCGIQQLGI